MAVRSEIKTITKRRDPEEPAEEQFGQRSSSESAGRIRSRRAPDLATAPRPRSSRYHIMPAAQ